MSLAGLGNNLDSDIAGVYLERWYFWATHRILTPVVKAAKIIKRHQKGIMNYIDSRISYGVPEGINSIVQSLKAGERGYRNISNFMIMIYIRCGDLHFRLPT
jgi:transposase